MRIRLHICTTMEPEQLLTSFWIQPTSASNKSPQLQPTSSQTLCGKIAIPRGKTKQHRVFWSEHLEELKRNRNALRNTDDQNGNRNALRNTDDQNGRSEDIQAWRRQAAVLRQTILKAERTSFDNFISNINYQSDSQRIIKFLGNLPKQQGKTHERNNTLKQKTAYHRLRNT
ncbi:unnamed protein product [Rodentolepis nana]|uniref:Uncharacterized protein n=1 Tax=Rodentolepis nana TaxID=102285 RepID=A0A0R3TDE7_RODNA|nr:unnamed protein product [Rodentolepis nana]